MSLQQLFESQAAKKPGIDTAILLVQNCHKRLTEHKLASTPEEQRIIDSTIKHVLSLLQIEQDWSNDAVETIKKLYKQETTS